jgi:hypothetical protein
MMISTFGAPAGMGRGRGQGLVEGGKAPHVEASDGGHGNEGVAPQPAAQFLLRHAQFAERLGERRLRLGYERIPKLRQPPQQFGLERPQHERGGRREQEKNG